MRYKLPLPGTKAPFEGLRSRIDDSTTTQLLNEEARMPGPVSRGRFVWYDLMTPDLDSATEFYTKVAGWGTTPWDGGGAEDGSAPYMMWTAGEKPIGGRMKLPEEAQARGAPPHWLAYVTVPDTEAVVERTKELGGSVLMPATTMEGVGTFAVLQDPQGAVFSPYTPTGGAEGEVESPGLGEFSWHELATTDHEAAFAFYSEVFGWKKTDVMDMGGMGIYQMFGPDTDGSFSYGGMYNKPAEMPAPPHWLYYITVLDIDAGVAQVQELGGKVLNGPEEVPGGDMVAQCMDPQGGAFALHAKKAATEE
jgi:predicted enzyme related to lactoylglutathione lyase